MAGGQPSELSTFGATRVIELSRDGPYLAGFPLARAIRLLDLASDWPTRAGASQAISSGRKDIARAWARVIFDEYDVDGLWYPSSMSGTTRAPGDPALHGHAVALFGAARSAFPAHPMLNLALDHPAIDAAIAEVAERLAYRLLALTGAIAPRPPRGAAGRADDAGRAVRVGDGRAAVLETLSGLAGAHHSSAAVPSLGLRSRRQAADEGAGPLPPALHPLRVLGVAG